MPEESKFACCVEYSKSSRSNCLKCKSPILKGIVRVGRQYDVNHSGYLYYHTGCFPFAKYCNTDRPEDFFFGWEDLKEKDQNTIRQLYPSKSQSSSAPPNTSPSVFGPAKPTNTSTTPSTTNPQSPPKKTMQSISLIKPEPIVVEKCTPPPMPLQNSLRHLASALSGTSQADVVDDFHGLYPFQNLPSLRREQEDVFWEIESSDVAKKLAQITHQNLLNSVHLDTLCHLRRNGKTRQFVEFQAACQAWQYNHNDEDFVNALRLIINRTK